jgi:hypothetical protein
VLQGVGGENARVAKLMTVTKCDDIETNSDQRGCVIVDQDKWRRPTTGRGRGSRIQVSKNGLAIAHLLTPDTERAGSVCVG